MTTSRHINFVFSAALFGHVGFCLAASVVQPRKASNAEFNAAMSAVEKVARYFSSSGDTLKLEALISTSSTGETKAFNTKNSTIELAAFPLTNALSASSSTLYVDSKNEEPRLLAMNVSGVCLSRKQFVGRYSDATLMSFPHGHSSEETYQYRTVIDGVAIISEFKEKSRDCMSAVKIQHANEAS
ncbi:hypothetical protein [Pseudoxanthomonas sp. JBR18]|uniref:hypothetical protein n=1 Tax=Pseudoxanthomonas sp. JBR18 TaxID=2969308 RepID=UPI002305B6AE|nr:hypothetical protein [Pseudoxanthomonas sp. JBR18]WCE04906.1 hypothetical protein PJ250_02635 [Pseudoxanthomonas sp. JBR18]